MKYKCMLFEAFGCSMYCSVQDPENHILLRNAETGCEMVGVSLEETANFFMAHLVNVNREQRVYEVS